MTPAEYLTARGWTVDKFDPGKWWPAKSWGKTWSMALEEAAVLQRSVDDQAVDSFGSVRYVPTDEQATTSPLCKALAMQGVTERDAIEHLFRESEARRDDVARLATMQPPAPIQITADNGTALLSAALKQAQAVGEAWKALACARCNLLVSPIGERRAKAAADVSAALKRLEDLGIPYRDTLGEP